MSTERKGKGKVSVPAREAYGGVELYLQPCLTSALEGGEWSNSHSYWFTSGDKVTVSNERDVGLVPDLAWTLWRTKCSLVPAGNRSTISM
jgi:hypothetical protein